MLAPALRLRMLEMRFLRRPMGAKAFANEIGELPEGQLRVLAPVEDLSASMRYSSRKSPEHPS